MTAVGWEAPRCRSFCSESGTEVSARRAEGRRLWRSRGWKIRTRFASAKRVRLPGSWGVGHRGQPRRLFAASSTRFSIARSSGLALSIRPSREPMDEHFFRWGGARASRTAQRRSTDQSEGSLQLCFLPRKESACARRGAVSGCATRGSGLRVLARLRAPPAAERTPRRLLSPQAGPTPLREVW